MTMLVYEKEIAMEAREEGMLEGRAMGIIETGFDLGLSESAILEKLQKKLNISLQTAEEYMERFGK